MLRVFAVLALVGGLAFLPQQSITVSIADGAVVGDIVQVEAKIASDTGITKVEFSVDDQARSVLMKPPWIFSWDTIDENEGPHTLIVSVYDSAGRASRRRVKLEVENGLSAGPKPHAAKAMELFGRGEFDAAMLSARKAYRLAMADYDAIRAMAAAVGGKGDFNRALDLLEKPVMVNNQPMGDPRMFPLSDLVSLELRGLFRILRAEKEPDPAKQIGDFDIVFMVGTRMNEVIAEHARTLSAKAGSAQALIELGDAAMFRGEPEAALEHYRRIPPSPDLVGEHRQAIALLAAGNPRQAEANLSAILSGGRGNETTQALLAAAYAQMRRWGRAKEYTVAGLKRKNLAAMIVNAYIELGARQFQRALDQLREVLARTQTLEAGALAMAVFMDAGDLNRSSRAFADALRKRPASLDLYTARAFQLAVLQPKDGMKQSAALLDFVLKRNPNHRMAKIGRALVYCDEKKYKAAEALLKPMERDEKLSPDLIMSTAFVARAQNESAVEGEALAKARKLDPEAFPDIQSPPLRQLMARLWAYRRPVLLTPAVLDPAASGG
jgi:predicted Zn-dependent protease